MPSLSRRASKRALGYGASAAVAAYALRAAYLAAARAKEARVAVDFGVGNARDDSEEVEPGDDDAARERTTSRARRAAARGGGDDDRGGVEEELVALERTMDALAGGEDAMGRAKTGAGDDATTTRSGGGRGGGESDEWTTTPPTPTPTTTGSGDAAGVSPSRSLGTVGRSPTPGPRDETTPEFFASTKFFACLEVLHTGPHTTPLAW